MCFHCFHYGKHSELANFTSHDEICLRMTNTIKV